MLRRCLLPLALLASQALVAEPWLRIDTPHAGSLGVLPPGARDYGGFVWLPEALAPQWLSLAGAQRVAHAFALDYGGQRIDPRDGLPAGGDPWLEPSAWTGADFRLVQLHGPPRAEDLAELRTAGVRPVRYLAPFAYVVWADAAQIAALRARSGSVRFAGDFLPIQRVPAQSRGLLPAPVRAMALVDAASAEATLVALQAAGATIVQRSGLSDDLALVELELSGATFLSAARVPGVYTVQRIAGGGGPRSEMTNQSVVGGYNGSQIVQPGYAAWLAPTGLTGAGVVVSVVDGGVRSTHADLAGAMVACTGSNGSCLSANDNHGTHVAGAIAGRGSSGALDAGGFLRGQGVAPGASLVQQRYGPFLSGGGPGGMVTDGMLRIYRDSAASGARLANNSWGPTGTPQGYDIPTMQVDMIARDADSTTPGNQPILTVWSIMNGNGDAGGACAPSSLGSPDEAKNLFAVGSTRLLSGGVQAGALFDVSSNSAHGPACDGRIVPHIVAPGCSTDSLSGSADNAFASMCGTSMASPVVSGAAALYWQRHRTRFGVDPSPALIKALFTAAASNLVGRLNADGGSIPQRPNRMAGWGRLDLDAIINPGVEVWLVDQQRVYTASGQQEVHELEAVDPGKPVRAMLAWTDAPGPGTGGTTPAWSNDLDLTAAVGVQTWRGNVIDAASGYSASGGASDARNNLEAVFLSPAQHAGGPFELRVLAATIAADALSPYTAVSPRQDYALVCYNCRVRGSSGSGLPFANGFEETPDGLFADGFE